MTARCADCGGGMTIRTGKGGRYRYYTCNNHVDEGATSCKGRSIPMPILDGIVLEGLEKRIFAPERLEALLRGLLDRARQRGCRSAQFCTGLVGPAGLEPATRPL